MLSQVLTRISRTDFGSPSLAGVRQAVLDRAAPDLGLRKLRFKRRLVCLESAVMDQWLSMYD
jgi:hypothetical protein